MLRFSIIRYWDLIKFPYFPDTTEIGYRGWKKAQRQGDFIDNSKVIYGNKWQPYFGTLILDPT
jgi:hypothetical protein